MKKTITFLFLLALMACRSVNTQYKEGVDFKSYQTFCWLDGCTLAYTGPEYLNKPEIQEVFKNSIIDNLTRKGLRHDSNMPDLLVDYHVTIEDDIVIRYHNQEDEIHYYKTPFTRTDEIKVTKGTIVVHIIDPERKELIWQSHAEGFLETPNHLSEKSIRSGIKKALQDFPPKSRN